eukprot:scaffold1621_cov262-Chaetoceros_neogracile.AAC.13
MVPLLLRSFLHHSSKEVVGLRGLRLITNATTQTALSDIIVDPTPTKNRNDDSPAIGLSLIGRPGSGKGTYGTLLAKAFGCPLIIVGDVLRDHVHRNTEIGKEISVFQKEGRLADDNLVAKALISHLEKLISQSDDNVKFRFILDGFPRSLPQAKLMFPSASDSNECSKNAILWPKRYQISFAVNIDVPDQICIEKMLGRRKCKVCHDNFNVTDVNKNNFVMPPKLPIPYPCQKCDMEEDWERRLDDTETIMRRRLEEFHTTSSPVESFFEDRGKLLTFQPFRGILDMPKMKDLVIRHARELVET